MKNIIFDYPQIEYSKSTKGNFIHSYQLSKNLSKYCNLYGIKPNSNPINIRKETGTIFSSKKHYKNVPKFINSLIQIFNVLRKKEIDLIYTRWGYSLRDPGLFIKILLNKKWIIEVNGIPWEEEKGLKYNKLFRKFYLFPLIIADKIICVSPEIKKSLINNIKLNPVKIVVIGNGVDEKIFNYSQNNDVRRELSIKKEKRIITYAGSIDKWQGLDTLVGVADKLKLTKNNFIFLIVGDGRYLNILKDKIEKKKLNSFFIFTGKVTQKEVVKYINCSDICIAPFVGNRKASPIKIFEYLSCGKKVVSSKIQDVIDLKLDEGIIYAEPGNVDSFVNAIKDGLKIKETKNSLKENRQLILEKYIWEKISRKIYKEIIDTLLHH